MDTRMRPVATRQYEEFQPETRFVTEEGAEKILVYLSDYKKEQLRVQLTSTRVLKISGERPLGGNKWQRFMKDVPVSPNCDAREITAKFEGGVLVVKQPKAMTTADTPKPELVQPKPEPVQPKSQSDSTLAQADSKPDGLVAPNAEAESSKLAETEKKCEEERQDERVSKGRVLNGGWIYKEMKKPENLKVFVVVVVLAVALAFHVSYVKRVCGL